METEKMVIGKTVKKKFFLTLFSGLLLLSLLIGAMGFTGTAFAVPLGGMGDFYVAFDELEGEGFELNPQMGETGNMDEAPLVRNIMDKATIDNLHIYKDLKMPTGKWIRINIIASEPTEIQGLIQDAQLIDADLSFDGMKIMQANTSDMSEAEAFEKNWTQSGDTVKIQDAKIVTDYLFQEFVALNGAKIFLESIDGPETTNNESGTNEGDSDSSAVPASSDNSGGSDSSGDGGSSGSGLLPETATQTWLYIVIGVGLIVTSSIILVTRKVKSPVQG